MKIVPQYRNLIETLRTYERSGMYAEALDSLSEIWKDISDEPDTTGLSKLDAAEIYLSCGKLAGFVGRMRHNVVAQENAKNLLTKAREIFIEYRDKHRIVESENGLALAYLRIGEHREAEAWIESALNRDLAPSSFARLESFICRSAFLIDLKRFEELHEYLEGVAKLFEEFDDDYLNGCFATNFGIAKKNLGDYAGAMQLYSLARHYHKKSGHLVYLATVENNMAYLYMYEGRYDLAYKCIERAKKLHKTVGDVSRLGFAYDTEADILLTEGRIEEALKAIETGIDILKKTEFIEFLIGSLATKMKILVHKGDIAGAAVAFSDAAGHALRVQGEKRVAMLAEQFEELLKNTAYRGLGRIFTQRIIPGEDLELELPVTLARYTNFDAVWIKNDDLEKAGLFKGSLALVVDEEIERGEIAAIVENGCEDVICGYFDREFGVVAIVNDRNSEPQIFAEETVEILGKIVGFADPENRRNGKLRVKPLNIH